MIAATYFRLYKNKMWFLHDGAPVHYTTPIHKYLKIENSQRWIGRGRPFNWPSRSPDPTKIDFFSGLHKK